MQTSHFACHLTWPHLHQCSALPLLHIAASLLLVPACSHSWQPSHQTYLERCYLLVLCYARFHAQEWGATGLLIPSGPPCTCTSVMPQVSSIPDGSLCTFVHSVLLPRVAVWLPLGGSSVTLLTTMVAQSFTPYSLRHVCTIHLCRGCVVHSAPCHTRLLACSATILTTIVVQPSTPYSLRRVCTIHVCRGSEASSPLVTQARGLPLVSPTLDG